MGRNADDGHIGVTVRYRVRKLNNFDQSLISSEILSHEHGETKLLEEALKASCVLRGPRPAKFFSSLCSILSLVYLCAEKDGQAKVSLFMISARPLGMATMG